tara:strand:+ start:25 stop:180 length:156 start_codon:yes stop_codon:yes gene_type:complete
MLAEQAGAREKIGEARQSNAFSGSGDKLFAWGGERLVLPQMRQFKKKVSPR